MTLSASDLNELDRQILDYAQEGRVAPRLLRELFRHEGLKDSEIPSRQYLYQRLKRLEEHNHLENLFGTGIYEFVSDPREQ